MVAEEEEKAEVVIVLMLVVCSIDGPLEAWECYLMIFGEIHRRKITGYRRTDVRTDQPTDVRTDRQTDGRIYPLIEMRGRI